VCVSVSVSVSVNVTPTKARAREGWREKEEEEKTKKATVRTRTHLPPPIDRIVHHDPIHLDIIVRLEDSLLDVDPHALAVQPDPGLADEPELKVDADLLACFLGELGVLAGW
jgi:hypothetical protein